MTAAEAAAQIAALTAAGQAAYSAGGAYSNGQIVAAGTPGGQTLASLTTPASGSNIFGATGLTQLSGIAKSLAAGYYQVPGQQGAEYFDPASGAAPSQAFVSWANGLTATDLGPNGQPTSGFIPAEGGVEAFDSAQAANQPADVANVTAITALMNSGMSAEDAQNKVLGIGPNQQFVTGANGQQESMAQAAAPQTGGGERDVSPSADVDPDMTVGAGGNMGYWQSVATSKGSGGLFDDNLQAIAALGSAGINLAAAGADSMFSAPPAPGAGSTGSIWVSTATAADFATIEADAQANADNLEAQNTAAYAGLQQENIIAAAKAAGIDPGMVLKYGVGLGGDLQSIADTGISAGQTQEIYDEYSRIQDPTEAAAFLSAQDPGNLTPGLREARNNTPQMQAQENWMTKNVMAPVKTFEGTANYGGTQQSGGAVSEVGGGVVTTFGDVTETDATTGRSIMFGNVATSRAYVAPVDTGLQVSINGHKYMTSTQVDKVFSAVEGAFVGAMFGGASGALLGAYSGAGGPSPFSMSSFLTGGINLKTGKGLGQWGKLHSGPAQPLTGESFGIAFMGKALFAII